MKNLSDLFWRIDSDGIPTIRGECDVFRFCWCIARQIASLSRKREQRRKRAPIIFRLRPRALMLSSQASRSEAVRSRIPPLKALAAFPNLAWHRPNVDTTALFFSSHQETPPPPLEIAFAEFVAFGFLARKKPKLLPAKQIRSPPSKSSVHRQTHGSLH